MVMRLRIIRRECLEMYRMRDAQKNLEVKPEGKKTLGRLWRNLDDNIKRVLTEYEGVH
jgi:hypothetical protein